jgi:hypothetical protein
MIELTVPINVLAIRIPPIETIMPTEEILSRKNEIRIRAEEHRRADTLRAIFEAWRGPVQAHDVITEWFDVEGRADQVVGGLGRRADWRWTQRTEGGMAPKPVLL